MMNNERDKEAHTAPGNEDKELSALYQRTRQTAPPDELDEAVLAASRREVQASPSPGHWQVPVSIAAVLVITVILVPLMVSDPEVEQTAQEVTPRRMQLELMEEKAAPAGEPLEAPAPEMNSLPSGRPLRRDAGISAVADAPRKEKPSLEKRGRATSRVQSLSQTGTDALVEQQEPAPEPWLEHIRELVEDGEMMAAFQELDAFRQTWPEYPIDPKLEEQLRQPVRPDSP